MHKIWTCGVRALPASIAGDPPVPVLGVLWTSGDFIVGASVFEGTVVTDAQLRESFDEAVLRQRSMEGSRTQPRVVQTKAPLLARRLQKLLPDVEVRTCPTPESDAAFDSLAESMSESRVDPMAEFMELDEPLRDELLEVSLDLFEMGPWNLFPPEPPLRVVISKCDVSDGRVVIIGHNGESFGLMLFLCPGDYEMFYACAEGTTERAELPKCYSLNFEPIAPERLGRDPALGAFPLPILTVFEEGEQRGPNHAEVKLLLATIVGLTRFSKKQSPLGSSQASKSRAGRYRMTVLGEKLEVRFVAPSFS